MTLRSYLSKSENVKHPGAHGSTHWYVGPGGEIIYGDRADAQRHHRALLTLRRLVRTKLLSDKEPWGFLTAFHNSRDHATNLMLNSSLFHDLHQTGANILSCRGYYTYKLEDGGQGITEEPAFLALGLSDKDAVRLGAKYNQESILTNNGFYMCDTPERVPLVSKRLVDGEIAKDQDQSVIYTPLQNMTFLVDGDWLNAVPAPKEYYDHLKGQMGKSLSGGEGGYTAPAPPSSNMSLLAAEINIEASL